METRKLIDPAIKNNMAARPSFSLQDVIEAARKNRVPNIPGIEYMTIRY